ncbi:ParA family protein [Saccharicrinis aurantiacus]|uniref:ParA family protein n=1 Tax=Saccharicrinis aurantiacus TaxID=1849719 RepID=UPI00094FB6D3|nr:ParA family protein [Saccharicrinis aurantiacus]
MKHIYAIVNNKGGVGKTSTVYNLSAGIARRNKRVLMIDVDPQANLTQSCGCDSSDNVYNSLLYDKELPIIEVKQNLFIAPSSMELSSFEHLNEVGKENILRSLIAKLEDKFDFVFIDCQPSLSALTMSALIASNNVIIPLQSHFLSSHGLKNLLTVISKTKQRLNPNLEVGGILLTMFKKNTVLSRDIADFTSSNFKNLVFKTKIRDNISIAEAPASQSDIFSYSPGSLGALDYGKFCSEFLARFNSK